MYLKNSLIPFVLFSGLTLFLTACGGGGSGDGQQVNLLNDPTQAITLDSSGEGGSGLFSALLLSDTEVSGTPSNSTGIVLIHGRGGNPDSAVVSELRKDLYERGYMTLSIQAAFPVAGTSFQNYIDDVSGPNYSFPETYFRVREAINELESRGATDIVLIGFSMGSRMVSAHVARGQGGDELPIIGLVGIGMYATSIDPLNISLTIDEYSIPVLDLYGDADTNATTTAATRVSAYGGLLADYTQDMFICDAGLTVNDCHKLVGLKGTPDSELETAVSSWIGNL